MPRVKKIQEKPYHFIIDQKQVQRYTRKGKKRKRVYELFMHMNNSTRVYCAYFGYWHKKQFHRVWLKTALYDVSLEEELYEMYENHVSILRGEVKLVRVDPKLLEEGYAPVQKNGKVLPEPYWEDVFMIERFRPKKDFDLEILADNGKTFKVASEHFKRIYVDNWFLK